MEITDIDIVIPWVDGNDPEWQKVYSKYSSQSNQRDNNSVVRFRDWDNLQYLFRGIEKYMPWVRKVHFVTCGQKPKWLNLSAPKLNFVTHEEFIPKGCLPTFSVRPIELNIHRIPGLADQFIYFNDDFFVLGPIHKDFFFKDGYPVDLAALNVIQANSSRSLVIANNVRIINEHFKKNKVIKNNKRGWYNLSYGHYLIKTLSLMQWPIFAGFQDIHLPQPFLKSTFEDVWNQCEDRLTDTTSHRFRDISDVNQYLFRYWQLASGHFVPGNVFKHRNYFLISDANVDNVCKAILQRKKYLLVLNDSDEIKYFDIAKSKIKAAFNQILPQKSSFEL